nr:integrase, catalytic region, zinc finger, CCHC-type, peptidase aspartic, catalytic [Tanacetum cinerariifolium]
MWNSIQNGPYQRSMVVDPIHPTVPMLELLSKMTEGNKKQYIADVRVMNYLLQAIPNDIYNSLDACKDAKEMAKKASKNHYPLALIAHSNASSAHSHANPLYFLQPYYVTHPPSVIDYDDEYQGELQGDSQKDKLTTTMMLLTRAISQKFSTPTNNHLQMLTTMPGETKLKGLIQEMQKSKVCDLKYFREKMLLAIKDEARSNLSNEENDFMLDTSYGEELEDLTATIIWVGLYKSERLKKAIATQPKMYDGDLIHSNKFIIDSTDLEETLKDAKEIQNKMRRKMVQIDYEKLNALYDTFVPQQELFADQTYFLIPSTFEIGSKSKDVPSESPDHKLKVLNSNSSCNIKNRKWLMMSLGRQKLSTLHDENMLLKQQVESTVKERENIKLEFQNLFNSIKATRVQHQNEINEMFDDVTQKSYAYADVHAQNQDLLMTIFELKSKLQTIDKGKHVNTKFDKFETLGQLLCVTPFNKNLAIKAKNVSNTKVTLDRKSSVKRALFTSPIIATSKGLGATSVVEKSRFSVATTLTATNKIVNSGCLKHMTGNLQLLRNCVEKFMGTVRFGNDHFAVITGYRDYVQGNLTICHVYYVEGLGHNLFSVGQFYDRDLEVAFRSNTCYVWNLEGEDLLMGSRDSNLYTISIFEMAASSPICLMSRAASIKSWLWHHRKPNVQYFYMSGSLCYPTNDHDDLGKMKPKAGIGIFAGYSESSYSQSIPSISDLDNLFGTMYDKSYTTSSQEVSDNSAANTLDNDHTSSSSIIVDQDDAPPIVVSSEEQVVTEPNSPVLNEVADEFVQKDVANFDGNMFHNAPQTPKFDVAESSSTY